MKKTNENIKNTEKIENEVVEKEQAQVKEETVNEVKAAETLAEEVKTEEVNAEEKALDEAMAKEEAKEVEVESVETSEEVAANDTPAIKALERVNSTDLVVAGIENSTDSLDVKAETMCRWAAGRAGVIVLTPILGTVALMANEVYLVSKIAKLYNKKLSEGAICSFLGAFGGTIAGNLLATLIPFGGIQVPIAVGVTYAVGKVAHAWIKDGMPSDMTPYIAMFNEWKEKAKEEAKVLAENPLKEIPLGDEKKDYLKERGERLGQSLHEVRGKIFDILEIAKEVIQDKQEDLSESASDIKEKAAVGADVIKHRASEKADVIKEKAGCSVEKLREKSENAALNGAELLAELAVKMSEVAEKTKEQLEEKKMNAALDEELTELKHLVKEAKFLADELGTYTKDSLDEIDEGGSQLDDLIRDALKDASEANEEAEEVIAKANNQEVKEEAPAEAETEEVENKANDVADNVSEKDNK